MYRCKYVLIIIVMLSYSIGSHLPSSWGWENSPLEWLQVVILFAGALLSGIWWHEAKTARQYQHARFFAWAIPIWLLAALREMGWGRVFYPQDVNAAMDPSFLALDQLPYGPIVYPVVALVLIIWLFAVIKHKLYAVPYKLFQQGRFPSGEFLLVIFAIVAANIAEQALHFEIMEEIVECVMYLSLILTAYCVKIALQQPEQQKDENFLKRID